jgi:hypothetical protein
MKLPKSKLSSAIIALPSAGTVRTSLRLERIRPTLSSQVPTVASIARQVNPRPLRHPFPLTVTGPIVPRSSRSDDVEETSQDTSDCSVNRSLRAMTASCDISPPDMLGGLGRSGFFILSDEGLGVDIVRDRASPARSWDATTAISIHI